MIAVSKSQTRFPEILRHWRRRLGISQLELALRSGSSQKHISFLESGRSNPSPMMIVALSDALEVPLRNRNELMLAAGFAPQYGESKLSDPELETVQRAVEHILTGHAPYPCVVFDAQHNTLAANLGALKFQCWLYGVESPDKLPAIAKNVLKGILHPDGYRRHITNWDFVASVMLRRLSAEALAAGSSDRMNDLLTEVTSYPGIPKDWRKTSDLDWRLPMLAVQFDKDGQKLSLFSTLTLLGAPYDVTLQEIRIESFFPADEVTRAFFETGGG